MVHHRYTTEIDIAHQGTGAIETVPAQVAIIGYEPYEPASPDCPASGDHAEIEILDMDSRPRLDWEASLSPAMRRQLADAAKADWFDTLDRERG